MQMIGGAFHIIYIILVTVFIFYLFPQKVDLQDFVWWSRGFLERAFSYS